MGYRLESVKTTERMTAVYQLYLANRTTVIVTRIAEMRASGRNREPFALNVETEPKDLAWLRVENGK